MKKLILSSVLIFMVSLLNANEIRTITYNLPKSDVYVSVDNSDPVLVKGKEVVIQLPKGEEHIVKFTKKNYKTKTELIRSSFSYATPVNVSFTLGSSDGIFKLPGFIAVDANLPDAEIYVNSIKMGAVPAQIQVTAGNHVVSVRKDLYHSFEKEIILEEKGMEDLGTVKLTENFGYFQITTNPSRAMIYINDNYIGKSPIPKTKIQSGSYTIKAVMDQYHDKILTMNLKDNDDITFPITMGSAFGALIVESSPESGATVFINDEQVGTTPYTNNEYPSGEYLISIEKEMWFGSEETIVVTDNQTTKAVLDLTRNYGKIMIKASQCNIYINDEFIGENSIVKNLKAGEYLLKAERENYTDEIKNISIEAGDKLTFALIPKPKMASLSIMSKPFATKGAEIFLNNNKRKETTPAVFETTMGTYNIKVKYPGYIDRTKKNIFLKKGELKELEFSMIPYKNSSLHKAKKWKTRKWISFVSGCLIIGGGVACNYMGDGYYDDYQIATNSVDAISHRDSYEKLYSYRDMSYYVSIAPFATFIYSYIKQIYYTSKAKTE